jgi:AcrR family transcriptional regulator
VGLRRERRALEVGAATSYGISVAARKLQPDDWAEAALDAIAEGGIGSVAVEALAPKVGASKGSFYWHFADRSALIQAAVELWERTRTDSVIADVADVTDARERLRRLFTTAFTNPRGGRVETALSARADDPRVRPVLQRVTKRRLSYVAGIYEELGFDADSARRRAVITYSVYLGFFSLREASSRWTPRDEKELESFLDELLEILTAS